MANHERLLRRKEVENMTSLGCSAIYLMMKNGEFPDPVRLSSRSVAWRESEIIAWINSRISTREERRLNNGQAEKNQA
ncbi:MAG: AlpA family transcriptional regulator [Magnetococcales bacterium]|nr:AlpA family transcriptional regulator [Magnetococcales bacterium]